MTESFELAVCIGRFQLYHHGQCAVLRRALAVAPRVVVVIGSAHQARSPRNPFTWSERAEMIRLSLTPEEANRVHFAPVRDYYDEARWAAAVRDAVGATGADRGTRVALVGHRKDATSEYLAGFPDWRLVDIGHQGDLHAKALRAALFTTDHLPAALAAIADQVPPTTVEFVRAWAQLPCFLPLRDEWRELARERALWDGAPYPPVLVTVDAVVQKAGHVLLIRRGRAPGRGLLALPGGFLEQRETVYQSALRELEEETGLRLLPSTMQAALRAVRVFDHPDRSQRGRVITHTHHFDLGDGPLPEVRGSDDASEASWVPLADVTALEPQFHDDHFCILQGMLGV